MEEIFTVSNIASWFFYIFIFSTAGILAHLSITRKNKLYAVLAIAIPTVAGGLRYAVGKDYSSYIEMVNLLSERGIAAYLSGNLVKKFEPTAYLLSHITLPSEAQAVGFFAITSGLISLFYLLGARSYSKKHTGLMFFVLMMTIFPKDLSGVRQGVAVAVCFFAVSFIVKRMPYKYLGLVAFASLFHYSAILMIAAYPLYWLLLVRWHHIKDKYYIFKIISLSAIGYGSIALVLKNLALIPFLGRYAYLLSPEKIAAAGTPNLLSKIAPVLLVAPFYQKLVRRDKSNALYMLLSILAVVFTSFGFFAGFIHRIANYFIPFYAILFVNVIDTYIDKQKQRMVIAFIVLYAIAHFTGSHLIRNSYNIFPYQFIF